MSTIFKRITVTAFLTLVAGCGGSGESIEPGPAGADPRAVVQAKAGTYEGSWVMSGRNAAGGTYPAMSWTDVAVADQVTVERARAYVHVTDTMTLNAGGTLEQKWIEGVRIENDGRIGPEFIEMNGVVTLYEEIEPDHFRYKTDVTPNDYALIAGVNDDKFVAGHHITDKVVTSENGRETHTVRRNTHIEWTDSSGKTASADFASLAGTHRKTQ